MCETWLCPVSKNNSTSFIRTHTLCLNFGLSDCSPVRPPAKPLHLDKSTWISLLNKNTGTSGTTKFIVYFCGLHASTYTQVIFRPSCTCESIKSYARWNPIVLTGLKHINYTKCLCLSIKVKAGIAVNFAVSPCILIHQVLFSPTHALFHTTMYQCFKLY